MRGHLNVTENERQQQQLQREAAAFSRTKANMNTPWPHKVGVTAGEWARREQEGK
jgi:hypothetical protein